MNNIIDIDTTEKEISLVSLGDLPELYAKEGRIFATSLNIAKDFDKEHKDVLKSIRNIGSSQEFIERNFSLNEYVDKIGRKLPYYEVTRDGFMFLVLGFTGPKAAGIKEAYITAFNFMEEKLRKQASFDLHERLSDPDFLRGTLLTYTEKVIALQKTIEEQRPDVEAYELISKSDGGLNLTDTAKTLQLKPKIFFSWIRENKWVYKRAGGKNYVAYQDRIQQGLLEHKVRTLILSDGTEKITEQVMVTPKGLAFLAKLINKLKSA